MLTGRPIFEYSSQAGRAGSDWTMLDAAVGAPGIVTHRRDGGVACEQSIFRVTRPNHCADDRGLTPVGRRRDGRGADREHVRGRFDVQQSTEAPRTSAEARACRRPVTHARRPSGRPDRPVLHSRPVRGLTPSHQPTPVPHRRGAHTRTVPTGMVPAGRTAHRPPATRSAEERTDRRSRTVPSVSMRQLLEAGVHFGHQTRRWNPEDEALHLRGAQRDPHHRPGPDRPASRRRPRLRPRDRRPRRPGPVRRHQEAGPGAHRRRRRRAPTSPTSTSAGWAACSPTS